MERGAAGRGGIERGGVGRGVALLYYCPSSD